MVGRTPCCEKTGLRKGKWTAEEDEKLINYIKANGDGSWRSLPKNAGLLRCGKSCRLRWMNYLREDVKRGNFTEDEEETIVRLHKAYGNRWSLIASHLPGRTDNEIKNYWNSNLSRKIYRFRSIIGPMLTSPGTTEVASTAKKRSDRVRRALAKKYNKKRQDEPHSTPSPMIKNRKNGTNGGAESHAEPAVSGLNDSSVPANLASEKNLNPPVPSCTEEWTDAFTQEAEFLGSIEEAVVDEDVLMHIKHFLESVPGEDHQNENTMMSDVRQGIVMNTENNDQERDFGANGSSSNSCSSPIVSCFNDEDLCWDFINSGGSEVNVWSDEEYMFNWH